MLHMDVEVSQIIASQTQAVVLKLLENVVERNLKQNKNKVCKNVAV